MERHHKAQSVLPSISGFNRRVAGVKCCTWLPAKIFSFIQLAFLAFFIICFVYMWCLWKLPQVHDAYPDDFSPCPASSYKILDDQNITTGCTPCPECLSGQQPIPPCGSTMQSEVAIECRACPSETYKEDDGIGTCKPCQTCGLRETITQCTSQKKYTVWGLPSGVLSRRLYNGFL
ncbi:tumor necrosis factor receptor super member 27 [Desmophyllum pertusum]|uniref:Tumor necrosis factor receptor super member 27 n=1 Tax=Desmophyllum pertusum TaxID=174260 RepID=A0A9W9ZKA5_9CNID|nr:tumor necrosis factor receptor super member 27 [Desmophyllum pertusum]